ncbi:SusD/RagB family nutrient-binding outer membrane lipoprotein [Sphingobacterium faecium]|uniref:SusD/RagB family nutrient-binding outer membrane lipoprotein n=1 Tax=Sphingobacterium faecium TaxID=34087 RepID=UPI0024694F08|nr:SusD/RagB family nutrient-binding outer membrane lipoprotein [Sphingobacterium faecium]MDH5827767.1 SusD/RagB family nutrient-binding outer membrane lipoprotein [Sphingobacterium faecium]
MKKINKIKNIALIALSVSIVSCDKQLDINTDPNNPLALKSSVLLPRVEKFVGESMAMGTGFSNNLSAYMHQMVHYGTADQYGAGGNDFYWGQGWDYSYRNVITNANIIIEQDTEKGNLQYVGIAKILKAYSFSILVDLFGKVPYSEANQLVNDIKYPVYDDGAAVYPQLITLIDEAIADLQNTSAANLLKPGADDIIYNGKIASWLKAANSLKFKLLVQQRKVKDVKSELNALLTSGNLISNTSESFVINYGPNGATDDRNPGFGEYYASQRTMHVSPWLYEIMKGYNTTILTGIEDPRIPYYIYNQMTADDDPNKDLEYRDGGFVSKYFGSQGANRGKNSQDQVSLFGIYPVGGRYDDGKGGKASASSSTGAAPYRLITYNDILFYKAELIQEGLVAGDAAAALEEAIEESFNMIDQVVKGSSTTQAVPVLAGSTEAEDYTIDVMKKFNAANAAKKLEYIMTQKWLANIGSWVDQYTDYRRTGYPVLFDPNTVGGKVTPPAGGNGGEDMPAVPVISNRKFPNSLPYILDEISLNKNAPAQKTDLSAEKVFWMP